MLETELVLIGQQYKGRNLPAEVVHGCSNIQYYINGGRELKYKREEGEWD